MLALTRRDNESVLLWIPGRAVPVTIKVVTAKDGSARLSFDADRDILILREELNGNPEHSIRPAG